MKEKYKKIAKVLGKILLIFVLFELISQTLGALLASHLWSSLKYGKYSAYFVSELTILILSLILVFVCRKKDIFKERKLSFKASIRLCLPILILSIIMLLVNSVTFFTSKPNIANFISLLFYATSIGLFEEILFRGVIEGSLLDNFHSTKKQVLFSIVTSALIFGLLHLTNLLVGQDVLTTIMQVIQTIAIGILLGTVYYFSKNIWALAFLHGFYDFSVLLSEVNLIKDCEYASNVPSYIMMVSVISSIVLSLIYLVYCYGLFKKSNINKNLGLEVSQEDIQDDVKRATFTNTCIGILIMIFFIFNGISSVLLSPKMDEYYLCYEYPEKTIANLETHYYSYYDFNYSLGEENYHFYLKNDTAYLNDEKIIKDVYQLYLIDDELIILSDEKLYYIKLDQNNILDIKNQLIEFAMPQLRSGGYILDHDSNTKYPMVKSSLDDFFIIENNKIYQVK